MSENGRALRIGQVLATSYAVFARNFLLFFVLAFAANIPNLVIDFLAPPPPPPWINMAVPGVEAAQLVQVAPAAPIIPSPWLMMPLVLAGLALSFVLSAAATYMMIADLRGTPFHLGEALASGLRALLPLLGILGLVFLMILGFAMVVGFVWAIVAYGVLKDPKSPLAVVLLLFIIPVVIAMLRFSLVVPVVVAERAGAITSLKRSAELTKGSVWRLLGIFVLAALIFFAVNAVLFGIAFAAFGFPAFFSSVFTVVKHVVIAAEVPFYWAVVAVIYYYLRSASEAASAMPA